MDELTEKLQSLDVSIATISAKRKTLKHEMREAIAERDKLLAVVFAAQMFAGISPAEREALKAALAG